MRRKETCIVILQNQLTILLSYDKLKPYCYEDDAGNPKIVVDILAAASKEQLRMGKDKFMNGRSHSTVKYVCRMTFFRFIEKYIL